MIQQISEFMLSFESLLDEHFNHHAHKIPKPKVQSDKTPTQRQSRYDDAVGKMSLSVKMDDCSVDDEYTLTCSKCNVQKKVPYGLYKSLGTPGTTNFTCRIVHADCAALKRRRGGPKAAATARPSVAASSGAAPVADVAPQAENID